MSRQLQLENSISICLWTIWAAVIPIQAQAQALATTPDVSRSMQRQDSWGQERAADRSSAEGVISSDDLLDVYIIDVPELSRQYRVNPAGTIQLPLLPDPLPAANMKPAEFAASLEEQLRHTGLVSNPHVTVSIVASRIQAVAIAGAVKKPQVYPVFGRTTLIDMLSQTEGLDQDASNVAIVTRGKVGLEHLGPENGSQTIDLQMLLESGNPAYNVDIYPGDRITVPRAGIVYVVGAVNKPGGFAIRSAGEGLTVLQALALAEDVKSTAKKTKAMIIRAEPGPASSHLQIPLDVNKILSGKAQDTILHASDILFIPDNQSARALHRGVESAIALTTGMAIYSLRF